MILCYHVMRTHCDSKTAYVYGNHVGQQMWEPKPQQSMQHAAACIPTDLCNRLHPTLACLELGNLRSPPIPPDLLWTLTPAGKTVLVFIARRGQPQRYACSFLIVFSIPSSFREGTECARVELRAIPMSSDIFIHVNIHGAVGLHWPTGTPSQSWGKPRAIVACS